MQSTTELLFKWKGFRVNRNLKLSPYDSACAHRRLGEITKYHIANNPKYREWSGLTLDVNLDQIPSLKKSDFQKSHKSWISEPFRDAALFRNSTSGSSGVPLHFVKDWSCHSFTWAFYHKQYSLHGIDVFKDLEARFYGIPQGDFIKNFKERIKDWILNRSRFTVFDLSDSFLEKYYQKFCSNKYVYINGYTSSLVKFAEYLIKRGVVLVNDCPSLKLCITTSEMCSQEDRIAMERGFGVRVLNEYGAAELGIIAFEDIEGDWLINDENLFVEVVDDSDNALPDGEEGKILVTALNNKAMPFVRYELGDRGIISPHRKNGFRVLEALTGRTNDFAVLRSGKRVPGLTFYYVTKALLKNEGLVNEVIVQQVGLDSFKVVYCAENKLTTKDENKVKHLFTQYIEPNLNIQFSWVDKIHRQSSGKLKQFEKLEF